MTLKNLTKNKKFLIFAIASIAIFLAYFLYVFYVVGQIPKKQTTDVLERGRFNEIVPEKTGLNEVGKKLGNPISKSTEDGISTFYYDSSQKQQYDFVWSRGNKVVATGERVSETSLDSFIAKLGSLYISLYDKDVIPARWFVFPEKGVALRVWENNVYVFIRFAPQTKELFLKNIAPLVGISEKKIEEVAEPGIEEVVF